jgi:hypothetical protein
MAEPIKEPLPLCVGCRQPTVLEDSDGHPWCQTCDEKAKAPCVFPGPYHPADKQKRFH